MRSITNNTAAANNAPETILYRLGFLSAVSILSTWCDFFGCARVLDGESWCSKFVAMTLDVVPLTMDDVPWRVKRDPAGHGDVAMQSQLVVPKPSDYHRKPPDRLGFPAPENPLLYGPGKPAK